MSEYYGSSLASSDFFAHYGVRGMKWGVRKALASGGSRGYRKLGRQYKKAAKKLAKLNANADTKTQASKAVKMNKIAKTAKKVGLAGAGALAGLHLGKDVNNVLYRNLLSKAVKAGADYRGALDSGDYAGSSAIKNLARKYERDSEAALDRRTRFSDSLGTDTPRGLIGIAARTAAVGGLGTAAVAKGKAIAAKRRTTAKGHAKAVAKRDAWKKQMQSAFKGTQYANLPAVQKRTKRRKK